MEYTVRNSYDEFIDEEFECETEPDLNELNNIGCQKASNIDTNDVSNVYIACSFSIH